MTLAADLRHQVQALDETGVHPTQIADTLGIPVARVEAILDSLDPPHPHWAPAPAVEPLERTQQERGTPLVVDEICCGTVPGYHLHRRRREPVCRECMDAYNADRAPRRGGRPIALVDACGTPKGFWRHKGRKEPQCDPCRLAHNAERVEKNRAKRDAS